MKWFKHSSDSYTNLKMQELIALHGMEGYGFFWLCCELVAQQGDSYKIDDSKNWKRALSSVSGVKLENVEKYLKTYAELRLIEASELAKNRLFIPKMSEYSDDYTTRVRRVSEQSTDKVPLDKIRIDKNREEENIRRFADFWEEYPRKVAKPAALRAWHRIAPSEKLLAEMVSNIRAWKEAGAWEEERYIPHPTTWLNQERWTSAPPRKKTINRSVDLR